MKVAIITDTHYGCRKGSKIFHDYFEKFYNNIFFPYLDENGIDTVLHLGDVFDIRKSIDYQSLDWTKKVIFDPMKPYKVHMLTGNHDLYYKNTNIVNSLSLLLNDYPNIKIYSDPEIINLGGVNILLLPWICESNSQIAFDLINKNNFEIIMGHLELKGFQAYRGHIMEDGLDPKVFKNCKKVFSGHYHTRSDDGRIFYLGNPYELFWNDVDDSRGFTVFDTNTLEHTFVDNPYKLFKIIHYDDLDVDEFDFTSCSDKIVKIVIKNKTSEEKFEKFIQILSKSNIHELKVIENFNKIEMDDFEVEDSEDTLTLLNKYIDEVDFNLDKVKFLSIVRDIYQKSYEMV